MSEESNINIFTNSIINNVNIINDVEFPIEYPEDTIKIIDINEENEDIVVVENERYKNIIEALGLNININYPINVLTDAIVELHMNNSGNKYPSSYTRCYQFKYNPLANKVKNNLVGYKSDHMYSKREIKYILRNIIHRYKYDIVIDKVDNKNNIDENQVSMIGFNYSNPRWRVLTTNTITI